jgi:hypothetical protein
MMMSALIPDPGLQMMIFPVLVMPFNLLSGFYVDLHKVVHVLREVQYISLDKYAFNLFGKVVK